MEEILNELEQFARTRANMLDYQGRYEMTHLVSQVGDVLEFLNEILPADEPGIWAASADDIRQRFGFALRVFEPIQSMKGGQPVYYPKTLRVLVRKLRNGLAHKHTERVNRNRKFVAVIIRNFYPPKSKQSRLDTEAEFTCDELKAFGLFLADEYLKGAGVSTTPNAP